MAPNATRAGLLSALLVALLATPALAQVPAPQVAVTLDATTLSLGANNTTEISGTVRYSDLAAQQNANVVLTLDGVPDGWTITMDPAAVPLNSGQSGTFVLTITAPEAGAGAANGTATVIASANGGAGRGTATGSASLALTRVDPPPPPPPDNTPYIVAAVLATLLVAGAVAAYASHRKAEKARLAREAAERAEAERLAYIARETGITVSVVEGAIPFGDRREVAMRLVVKNVSERDRFAVVDVKEVPTGWLAAVNVPRRELKAGEEMIVTVTARPPDASPLGASARIVVAAKPEEAVELDERVTFEVQAADARPAQGGFAKAALSARDGVVPKMLRR